MLGQIAGFLMHWLPNFEADHRSYLTVAIGCTGGQHRSVAMARRVAEVLRGQGRNVIARHRDVKPASQRPDSTTK